MVLTTVGGRVTSTVLASNKRSTVQISRAATGKVAQVLGR